ncbi:MAG: YeeE/YedE family protein [Sandarakinorhabdus sp.]|nr:YeeE/YedE family protein [Sandarakinorhabdus sp.]
MIRVVLALFSGTLFGVGLAVSGMADPVRVRAFLDLFGTWDPTLAFVMAGAILPMALAWMWQRRLIKPFADTGFSLPDPSGPDLKLASGAVLFGAGWGIAGLCPGPAIAGLVIAPIPAATFVAAMLAGMLLHRALGRNPANPGSKGGTAWKSGA